MKRGRALQSGNAGQTIFVNVEGSFVSKPFICAESIASDEVVVMGDRVFPLNPTRTVLTRTNEYSRFRPLGVPVETGKVKMLFSRVIESERVFLVGGDREEPIEILRLPVADTVSDGVNTFAAYISNTGTGEDDWIVGLLYGRPSDRYTGGFTIRVVKGVGEGWQSSSIYAGDTNYKGHGLWLSASGGRLNTIYTQYADFFLEHSGRWESNGNNTVTVTLVEPPYLSGTGTFTQATGGSATSESQSFYLLDNELTLNPKSSVANTVATLPDRITALYNGSVLMLPGITKDDEYHNLNFDNSVPNGISRVFRFYSTMLADKTLSAAICRVTDDASLPPRTSRGFKHFYLAGGVETPLPSFNLSFNQLLESTNLVDDILYRCSFNFDPDSDGELDLTMLQLTDGGSSTTEKAPYQAIGSDALIHSISYHP